MLLEDAGILTERRRLILPVVGLPDHDLQRVLGVSTTHAQRKRHRNAERTGNILESVHAISSHSCFTVSPHLTFFSILDQRRRFTVRFGLAFARTRFAFAATGAAFLAAGAGLAVLLATRIDQYSQDRVRPVVLPVISPANLVSPADRVAMLEPSNMARTWYSAFLAE